MKPFYFSLLSFFFFSTLARANCEIVASTLQYLRGITHPSAAIVTEIENLEKGTAVLKGELLDVIEDHSGQESVVGQADRAVVHRLGLLHRSVVAFVLVRFPGEDEDRIVLQEFYSEVPNGETFIIGGHVQSGGDYQTAIRREFIEELGFPLTATPLGYFSQIEKDGDFEIRSPDGNNNERTSVFIYRAAAAETEHLRAYAGRLEEARRTLGEKDFNAWLLAQQRDAANKPTGLGEIRALHFVKKSEFMHSPLKRHWELELYLKNARVSQALELHD